MTAVTVRPHPVPRGEERIFFDALREHRLVFQRCPECAAVVFPLRTICPGCASEDLTLDESSRRGVIQSFTTQYRAGSKLLADTVPYTLALVDLDEGFRVLTGAPTDGGIAVDVRVRIDFDDADLEQTVLIAIPEESS